MGAIEVVLALTLLAVLGILITGLVTFGSASEREPEKSEFWMRMRVISQAVAIGLLALLVYLSRG